MLYVDDTVERLQTPPQLHVYLALDVHEDETASEAYRHHHQLCPEWPLELVLIEFLGGAFDENVERPHHAGDGHQVEYHRAHDLPSLTRRHRQLLPLGDGLELGVHSEVKSAQLAVFAIGAFDPLLETGLVNVAKRSLALAGRDEPTHLAVRLAVTYATEIHLQ